MTYTHHVLVGDCRDLLKAMPDASVDSIVTDPPYELGFMGKAWDSTGIAYDVGMWRECLRVLKPGGHMASFSGSRTYHRMACAIEDAGFEVRDQLMWIYGTGFPKSLDVSKAIAKRRTEDLEPIRVVCRAIRAAMDSANIKSRHLVEHFGGCNPRLIDHWAARDTDSQPALPTPEQWTILRGVLPMADDLDDEVARLNARKGTHGERWSEAEIVGEVARSSPGFGEKRFDGDRTLRNLDADAAAWAGWGTALKPAHEPICLARKPLVGTVARNVLEHGTGALNVDACRVAMSEEDRRVIETMGGFGSDGYVRGKTDETFMQGTPVATASLAHAAGRFPANVLHDGSPEVLEHFPNAGGGFGKRGGNSSLTSYGFANGTMEAVGYGDSGSAARFFYCAKASRADRDAGCDALEDRDWRHEGACIPERADRPFIPSKNNHPTVKPTAVMRWLVRLITPPGGVVLDPFNGSGSTGRAAALEGMSYLGLELSDEYAEIARRRIAAAVLDASTPVAPAKPKKRNKSTRILPPPEHYVEPVQLFMFEDVA